MCRVQSAERKVQSTVYSVQSTVYRVQSTECGVFDALINEARRHVGASGRRGVGAPERCYFLLGTLDRGLVPFRLDTPSPPCASFSTSSETCHSCFFISGTWKGNQLPPLNNPTVIVMDDFSPTTLLRFLLPQMPLLAKSALWHTLWLSPTSTKWDLRTELTVKILRELLHPQVSVPISRQQALTLRDPGIKGRMWISKATIPPPPEDDILKALVTAIEELKDGGKRKFTIPPIRPLEAEWTGDRANVDSHRPRLDLSEIQHYQRLMAEVASDVTILYFHGGAYYLCDPATHRLPVARLARLTRGRCLSVRYRLAPQHAFPAALLDAFLAYLSLLYPPPNALHSPVPASHIVFSGDSAGASLALSLLQLLLHLRCLPPTSSIRFHSYIIPTPIPLPAGAALSSAWTDLTRSMPSNLLNAPYDYLPPPLTPSAIARFPSCALWPTDPLRGDLYCDVSMLCHPLVSPLAARGWRGSCPLWFGYGQELLLDEGKAVAARAARQGVRVEWDEWEAMPHCFAQLLVGLEASKRFYSLWARFCAKVVEEGKRRAEDQNPSGRIGEDLQGNGIQSRGTYHAAKSHRESPVDVTSLSPLTDEEIAQRMRDKRAEMEGLEGLLQEAISGGTKL